MTGRLSGKVALVTGAANGLDGQLMGFGGAFARTAAREGASVVIADIDEDNGRLTAAQIEAGGTKALFARLDVTSEADWQAAIQSAVDAFGRLDVLVNSAGIHALYDVEHTSEQDWDRVMAVHGKGAFLGTKYAVPHMRESGGGSIVNISSIAAMGGSPSNTAYHAAKGAIRSFTKSAAIQLASDGIRVNSLHPGFADTPFTSGPFSAPGALERRLKQVPMGRLGTAQEVANASLYLASDESSYVTGAELVIDGGFLAQ
jgi:NAD(P)-dependent dehydrogenase (short-subunit alcohol dehydrogenase family)